MSLIHKPPPPRAAADDVRALLSLREAALLAMVPEAKVRKDLETGVLPPIRGGDVERLLFRWADVYVFAAVYTDDLLPGGMRRKAFAAFESLLAPSCRREFYRSLGIEALTTATCPRAQPGRLFAHCSTLKLGGYVFIDVAHTAKDVAPRVALYAEGLSRIEEREGVLGGEAVFRNTRLSVRHIGKMHDGGETVESIIEDYPYLRMRDIAFARLHWQAHPAAGRPRRTEETDFAGDPAAR
jgi:uncharacterized protein (DUF433 family)